MANEKTPCCQRCGAENVTLVGAGRTLLCAPCQSRPAPKLGAYAVVDRRGDERRRMALFPVSDVEGPPVVLHRPERKLVVQ